MLCCFEAGNGEWGMGNDSARGVMCAASGSVIGARDKWCLASRGLKDQVQPPLPIPHSPFPAPRSGATP